MKTRHQPLDLAQLAVRVAELYRPEGVEPWQARITHLTRVWLARPDAVLAWSEAEEAEHEKTVRMALPGRDHPPRWLGFDRPLDPAARLTAMSLVRHIATAVAQVEVRLESFDPSLPLRWRQSLTPRQLQVASLVASSYTNEQVAEELGIAARTVVRLIQEIFKRLGISARTELAAERALGRPPTPAHLRIPQKLDGHSELDDDTAPDD